MSWVVSLFGRRSQDAGVRRREVSQRRQKETPMKSVLVNWVQLWATGAQSCWGPFEHVPFRIFLLQAREAGALMLAHPPALGHGLPQGTLTPPPTFGVAPGVWISWVTPEKAMGRRRGAELRGCQPQQQVSLGGHREGGAPIVSTIQGWPLTILFLLLF